MKYKMKNINEIQVKTRQDFAKFLQLLKTDLEQNGDEWENKTLLDFLEAMSRYAEDIEHYYKNTGQDINADIANWHIFADILKGAKIYE